MQLPLSFTSAINNGQIDKEDSITVEIADMCLEMKSGLDRRLWAGVLQGAFFPLCLSCIYTHSYDAISNSPVRVIRNPTVDGPLSALTELFDKVPVGPEPHLGPSL